MWREPRSQDIEISYLTADRGPELRPEDLEGADAYVSYAYDLTAPSLDGVESLKLATRCGAGYDNFDLDAMTEHGVVATHAPQGPTASAAQAATGMIISCAHNFPRQEYELRERG
jgi:lactate dehydrogenase-like 2-hydroxyacid dehydrogenase